MGHAQLKTLLRWHRLPLWHWIMVGTWQGAGWDSSGKTAVIKISRMWKLAFRVQLREELKAWKETCWDCGKRWGLRKRAHVWKKRIVPSVLLTCLKRHGHFQPFVMYQLLGHKRYHHQIWLNLYSDWNCLCSWNECNYMDEKLTIKHHSFCTRWPRSGISVDTAVLLQSSLGMSNNIDYFPPNSLLASLLLPLLFCCLIPGTMTNV